MLLLRQPGDQHDISTSIPRAGIVRQAEERFRRSGYLALRDVSCLAGDGTLTLHGRLPSYYLKQVAQEIALGLEGAHHVVNRIEVAALETRRRAQQLT
jgi:osmotically-inducible protein OsmY